MSKKQEKVLVAVLITIFAIYQFMNLTKSSNNDTVVKNTNTPKISSSKNVHTHSPTSASVKYDKLQQLYLDLNPSMSYKQMLHLVKSTGLQYSEASYNGSRTVQVAFTKGCTDQKRMKEMGDYLVIDYDYPDDENSSNDILSKYFFATCAYVPSDSSLELICHRHGYYFSYYKPGNYIDDAGNDLGLSKKMSRKQQLDYYFKHK